MSMPADLQRIQALDFWPGPITLTPLAGGITNHNYRVDCGGRSFVARVCEPREILGIDRRNETLCQRAANDLGIAPAVVRDEEGILISEFISARTMTAAEVRIPEFVARLAEILRSLHSGREQLTGEMLYFSVFQTIRTYAMTARRLGAKLPGEIESFLEDACALSRAIGPFHPALCHNDLLPTNILDDGTRISLVDWEYAGIGHPFFDLAGVSANCAFTEARDDTLLAAYRGEKTPSALDVYELKIFKTMSHLREALWSVIQTKVSVIDFDYVKYAADCFASYRRERQSLDREV